MQKPRILLMPDTHGWAFDFHLSYHAEELRKRGWHVDVKYIVEKKEPPLPYSAYDLAFNPIYTPCPIDKNLHGKLIRGIYGHKWAWMLKPRRHLEQALRGAIALIVPNKKLKDMISWFFPATFQVSEGTDPNIFRFYKHRFTPNLVAGWTGDPKHTWKRLDEIIRPACIQAGVELRIATNLNREKLCEFYNDVDIVLVASIEEGSPNSIFEAGACGRTVIGTAAGIIPEAVVDGKNGFIVDGSVQAFTDKLRWCKENIGRVRDMGLAHQSIVLQKYTVQRESEDFANVIENLYNGNYKKRFWFTRYQRITRILK